MALVCCPLLFVWMQEKMLAHKSDRHCKLLSLRDLRAGPGDPKKQEQGWGPQCDYSFHCPHGILVTFVKWLKWTEEVGLCQHQHFPWGTCLPSGLDQAVI